MPEVCIRQPRLYYEAEGDGPGLERAIRTGW
jgi:hypothetical protein